MIEQLIAKIVLFVGAIFAIFKAGKYKADAANAKRQMDEHEEMAVKEIKITQDAALKAAKVQEEVVNVKNNVNRISDNDVTGQLRKFWSKNK